jgi:hypothetical protein
MGKLAIRKLCEEGGEEERRRRNLLKFLGFVCVLEDS